MIEEPGSKPTDKGSPLSYNPTGIQMFSFDGQELKNVTGRSHNRKKSANITNKADADELLPNMTDMSEFLDQNI